MNSSVPPDLAEPSLEEILARIEPRLKRVLSRYRIPAQDADDLLQETFLIMVSKAGTIRNSGRLARRDPRQPLHHLLAQAP